MNLWKNFLVVTVSTLLFAFTCFALGAIACSGTFFFRLGWRLIARHIHTS